MTNKFNIYLIFVLFGIAIQTPAFGQKCYYQDQFLGGVTADGFSVATNYGTGTFQLYIPNGSAIKKAFLLCGRHGKPSDLTIKFSGNHLTLCDDNIVSNYFNSPVYGGDNGGYVHLIDVTTLVNPLINNYSIEIPNQGVYGERYTDFYLVLLFENYLLGKVAFTLLINSQNFEGNMVYSVTNLLPINVFNDVGLAVHGGYMCDTIIEPSALFVENVYLGKLGGSDLNNNEWCAGVVGSFAYYSSSLYGMEDDSADLKVKGTDALSNISSLLSNNVINTDIEFKNTPSYNSTNSVWSLSLAYTSPCDTFSVTHTPDTTVCQGAQVPLFVTGGQTYEWTPQIGLSCYDCPNPIFSADSTMHYSIRIWNNDSCSKVLPLHIVVEEALPHFNFDISPTECGDSTGSITITPALNGFSYINQTTQDTNTTGFFSGLESGFYPISILNNSACSFDTVVFVPETLSVHAGFIASPNAGISPLPVAFTNTSSHANSYQWIYENQSSTQENINHIFQQDGIYPVMLIAYGNSILCADTAYDTIYVYLPIEVEIPNVFTPNSDQNNDQWGIKINVPAEVDLQIFNRWGEVVLNKKEEITAPGFVPLWDGGEHVGGVYYYVIRVRTDFEKKEFKGNITLVR